MKIVVLGGAGDMGSATVQDLLKFTDVRQVTVAARNTSKAEKMVSALGDPRAVVQKIDASSHVDLVKVMQGHDVAAGALGPFYRFEKPLVEAALAAGVDYVSICDDHDAVQAVLSFDRAAAEKGRKIITGLGWTPGITNILARKGYDELEEVDTIRVFWAGSAGDSEGLAVILHTLHIFTGKVASFQGGQLIDIHAGSGKEIVDFPQPLGEITVFHLGHPEPVTLPRYLPGVQEVILKGGLVENYLSSLAKMMTALGLTSTFSRKHKLGTLMKKLLPFFPAARNRSLSGARVDIAGKRNGKKVQITYATVDRMRRLTGIPLSIGAYMLGQGKIKRCGVFGPEADGAIYPDAFIQELARRNIKVERWETVI
ncbi:MAG TPA: saccharopine dehydrogenase [Firmicutes bacterium]|jgi:lysine 6-dehydrogenase|nr:saccharopine dehydrogenase [Bacillota bacterium]